ncbi:diacylglycerol kinase [Terasakiella brassicae]|uniref:Diacylglycerol kinase n=1 Tax=Terasakiella brassicae TaxID=1634917 RepID=A0A917C474_9PROT|nr:cytochrome c [Terasakiella brassicae]GGF71448.1 diacylglycerol kinase [Terasakiella brassicae]
MKRTALFLILFCLQASPLHAAGDAEKGKYILNMGGCISCHHTPNQKGADLSGGLAIKSPFGTFYVPNITPEPDVGIGGWSDEDFIAAMTQGISPDGSHYYPAFPYTSYTQMTRQDLLDLKAYLDTVAPSKNVVPEHDIPFPFNMRFLMMGWKMMFFDEGTFTPNPNKSEVWNRGAYIVNGPAHCGECHTPRNSLGGSDTSKKFQGNPNGPDKEKIPNIRPKGWEEGDYRTALRMGMTPDGDFLGGSMGHVIAKTTSKLTKDDLNAVITYLVEFE